MSKLNVIEKAARRNRYLKLKCLPKRDLIHSERYNLLTKESEGQTYIVKIIRIVPCLLIQNKKYTNVYFYY